MPNAYIQFDEDGLATVRDTVFTDATPEAAEFRQWLATDVLPILLTNGYYIDGQECGSIAEDVELSVLCYTMHLFERRAAARKAQRRD